MRMIAIRARSLGRASIRHRAEQASAAVSARSGLRGVVASPRFLGPDRGRTSPGRRRQAWSLARTTARAATRPPTWKRRWVRNHWGRPVGRGARVTARRTFAIAARSGGETPQADRRGRRFASILRSCRPDRGRDRRPGRRGQQGRRFIRNAILHPLAAKRKACARSAASTGGAAPSGWRARACQLSDRNTVGQHRRVTPWWQHVVYNGGGNNVPPHKPGGNTVVATTAVATTAAPGAGLGGLANNCD